ncbi:MAG: enoyl-CoA hydratase-related protein, partial [Lacisediminimonas sp.]|nr:enoyl-CoA hydratase-related protein [Lacisediminimonas sp.]
MAGASAAFHPAFIKIGLSGSELAVSWRLQRTMGISRTGEMLLTGEPMNAEEAHRVGLVSKVIPDAGLAAE